MKACEFEFDVNDEVTILPLELSGRILQRCDRGAGVHDYQVVFWSNGDRKSEWVLPHEIKLS